MRFAATCTNSLEDTGAPKEGRLGARTRCDNQGERSVRGVDLDEAELVRHRLCDQSILASNKWASICALTFDIIELVNAK